MRAVLFAFVALFAIAVGPSDSHACSIFGKAILSSLPSQGELDVPTDVAPILRGYFIPDSIEWRTADGTNVVFSASVNAAASGTAGQVAELTAREPLRAHTRYIIRAQMLGSPDIDQLEFETGETKASGTELTPPTLEPLILTGLISDCVSAAAVGCIEAIPENTLVELTDATGKVLVRDVVSGDTTIHVSKTPTCLRASARSPSGRLSNPTELCGDALSKRPIREGDLDFLTCSFGAPVRHDRDGGVDGGDSDDSDESSSGLSRFMCSATPAVQAGTASRSFAIGISFALAAFARRARRSRRRTR